MDEVTRKLKVCNIEDGGTSTEATEVLKFDSMEAFVKWCVGIERATISSLKKLPSCCHWEKRLKSILKKHDMKKKKRKQKKSRNGTIDLEAPPRISRNLEGKIEEKGGRDIKLVAIKQLSRTDLNKDQSRLTIHGRKIRAKRDYNIMTEKEDRSISKTKMDVMMMEPCGEASRMVIDKWEVGNSELYVLRRGWNGFLQRNHDIFKVNDFIQVWSFHVDTQLWFAIDRHLRNDLCLGMDGLSL